MSRSRVVNLGAISSEMASLSISDVLQLSLYCDGDSKSSEKSNSDQIGILVVEIVTRSKGTAFAIWNR